MKLQGMDFFCTITFGDDWKNPCVLLPPKSTILKQPTLLAQDTKIKDIIQKATQPPWHPSPTNDPSCRPQLQCASPASAASLTTPACNPDVFFTAQAPVSNHLRSDPVLRCLIRPEEGSPSHFQRQLILAVCHSCCVFLFDAYMLPWLALTCLLRSVLISALCFSHKQLRCIHISTAVTTRHSGELACHLSLVAVILTYSYILYAQWHFHSSALGSLTASAIFKHGTSWPLHASTQRVQSYLCLLSLRSIFFCDDSLRHHSFSATFEAFSC